MKFIHFLNNHKTKIIGLMLAAIGSIQASSATIQTIVSPKHFAFVTIGAGFIVAILGFLNSAAP